VLFPLWYIIFDEFDGVLMGVGSNFVLWISLSEQIMSVLLSDLLLRDDKFCASSCVHAKK